ncbi:MAG: Sensory box sensor histidine kinase/response regulator (EC [uncultured Caballeronia sp.]|nr:MAG: Sensory box sensor histidine kinase/response regulator (EC [uncultured Caballeronia sp.]
MRERVTVEAEVAEQGEEISGAHERILVIEEDVDVRMFLVDCLKMLGYTVTEASHGRAGLERLHTDDPDLLMVDFAMPSMNGLEVIAEAKRSRSQLPMILGHGMRT